MPLLLLGHGNIHQMDINISMCYSLSASRIIPSKNSNNSAIHYTTANQLQSQTIENMGL